MPTKCFFIEPTVKIYRALRRYTSSGTIGVNVCSTNGWYHQKSTPLDIIEGDQNDKDKRQHPHDDPRWPTQCDCGYVFTTNDVYQVSTDTIYRRLDNGEDVTLRNAPDGAMWYADWMIHGRTKDDSNQIWIGPDGHCLVVKVVGGHDWMVDGQCNNCTMPHDKVHKCWVRHGDPRTSNITIDKNGYTCQAGAGSILTPNWHGFLRDGWLVE